MRATLLSFLQTHSFRRGHFELASGGTSDYFIDVKRTAMLSRGAFLIGDALYSETCGWSFDAIGGPAMGAIPLVVATMLTYHLQGETRHGFWVREQAKDHGTQQWIEGCVLTQESRVVLVEDVITTGQTTCRTIRAVRERGATVVAVVALVDRLQGGEAAIRQAGVTEYRSVFTIKDFGIEP